MSEWVNLDHPELSEGWAHPTPASKCHYFREGKSLCGVHLLRVDQKVAGSLDEGNADDCRGCQRVARSEATACCPEHEPRCFLRPCCDDCQGHPQ